MFLKEKDQEDNILSHFVITLCDRIRDADLMQSIENKVKSRIYGKKRVCGGSVIKKFL